MPPSAWITSQSMVICRSPSACRSTTARSERPISRWISTVRPPCLPAEASRRVRSEVARGSMPYSAVTQPRPWPLSQGGSRSSRLAVTSTWVSPNFTKQEPSAYLTTPRSSETARNSSGLSAARPHRALILSGILVAGAHHNDMPGLNKGAAMVNCRLDCKELGRGLARRPDRLDAGEPRGAQRALARDFPPDRRELSDDRRAGRLAQSVAHPADGAVAGLGAQRDVGPRAARPDLRAAYLGRPAADRARPALFRRCADGGRRPHRRATAARSRRRSPAPAAASRWKPC